MRKVIGLMLLALCLAAPLPSSASEELRAYEWLVEAEASPQYLWTRNGLGQVIEYDRQRETKRLIAASGVLSMTRQDGRLIGLRQAGSDSYEVADIQTDEALSPAFSAAVAPAFLLFEGDAPLIVGAQSLWRLRENAWERTKLSDPLYEQGYLPWGAKLLSGGDVIAVYYSFGEFGGLLNYVFIDGGQVIVDPGGADYPLGDTVNAVINDSANEGCLLYASGTAHMGMYNGYVARHCDDMAELVFQEPMPELQGDLEGYVFSYPIYDLVETEPGWVAVSIGRIYRNDGETTEITTFDSVDEKMGLRMLEPDESLIVLFTHRHRQYSISGPAPLLVPVRE